jgi:uncharacterized damage-inducible protein DinB
VFAAADTLTPEQYTRDLGSSFKSIRDTLVHLYSAERAWYERWQGGAPTGHIAPDSFADLAALRRAWSEAETKVRAFVTAQDEAGFARVYQYKLFNGSPGASPLWQMVTHVVNHGTYHRGQVTTMLRQVGATPAKGQDLIAYYREKSA